MLTTKTVRSLIGLACISSASICYAASNFNISPKAGTSLPDSVAEGDTVSAFYTVTNLTRTLRNNYTVQGLPNTVSQNSTSNSYPDVCSNPISLAAKASCTLVLDIRGTVQSNFAICNGMNCTSAAVPLNVIATETALPMIATGEFLNNSFTEFPLLGLSQNHGSTWSYPEPVYGSAFPNPIGGGHLYGASCNGMRCIAQGCFNYNSVDHPLLVQTLDGGKTWSYPAEIYNPAIPADFQAGNLNGASVNGQLLVSSGYYFNGLTTLPIIAVSQNGGLTWNYPTGVFAPANLPATLVNGQFWAASCASGSLCATSGSFTDGSSSFPLIAVTQNAGSDWTYPSDVYTTALPISFVDGAFYGASCSSSVCIATGHFDDGSTDLPLLAVSQNNGLTWTYPAEIYTTALPVSFVAGNFRDNSCSSNHCIAVGQFDDNTDTRPWIAVSLDNGSSWNYPAAVYSTSLPTPFGSGHFNGGSCSGNLCIAAGAYEELGNQIGPPIPLIAISHDGGATWDYPAIVRSPSILPSPFVAGEFFSASCSGTRCIAAGIFDNGSTDLPFLIVTQDAGATWTYPNEIYTTALPPTFFVGAFDGSSSVSQLGIGAQYLNKFKPK